MKRICGLQKMKSLLWIFISNLLLSRMLEAYRALVIIPLPSKSHGFLGERLVQLIAEAGNEVTYLTSFPLDNPPAGVKQIALLEENLKKSWSDHLDFKVLLVERYDRHERLMRFIAIINKINSNVLQHKDVQRLLNDPNEKYDVVIAEWLYSDIYAGIATIFDCPLIWFSTIEHHWKILRMIDDIPNPAYTSDIISKNQLPFNFLERIDELEFQIWGLWADYFYLTKVQTAQYEDIIAPAIRKRGKDVPTYEEVIFNASLVLGNSHVSLANPISLPSNYIQIAGYHIENNPTPLTGDLKSLMDNATHGVIYFSFGSNLKSETFPDDLKNSLIKMFGELKQIVLWKYGNDIPNKPSNVHVIKWAPQRSILAHHNCVLFITHGGILSMIEAVHFAKPIIGIPVFGDQFRNVATAVRKGYAKKVGISFTISDDIRVAIQEILSNPSYAARAKEASFIYSHRPVSPSVELLHWVNHVVKTRGALHLRSPALLLAWYQKMYLDLILLIVVMIFGLKILVKRLYLNLSNKKKKD